MECSWSEVHKNLTQRLPQWTRKALLRGVDNRQMHVPSPPFVHPPPPPLSIPPPGGGGDVTWPMNNKKSIGNHRCQRR